MEMAIGMTMVNTVDGMTTTTTCTIAMAITIWQKV